MFVHVIPLCYVFISTPYLLRTVDLRFRRTLSRGRGLEPLPSLRSVQGLKTHANPLGVAALRSNQLIMLPNM